MESIISPERVVTQLAQSFPDLLLRFDRELCLVELVEGSEPVTEHPVRALLGATLDACISIIPSGIAAASLQQTLRDTVQRALEERTVERVEVHVRWPDQDGHMYDYELRVIPLDEGLAVLVRDVTRQRALENQLVISERMASLGTLAAGVAHEINNPLTYIQCNLVMAIEDLEALQAQLPQLDLSDPLHGLRVALEGAERVARITHALKNFSRVEAPRLDAIDLHDLLESSISLASNELRHRARLLRRYDARPLLVYGDPHQLSQVFINLLVNAAQSFDGCHVEDACVTLTTSLESEQRVLIMVQDNGMGIPAETLRRIFDPFFTTKRDGGTGLGLSVSHRIVQGLDGQLDVESAPGLGTTMRVLLPSIAPHTRASPEELTLSSPRATGAILFVIDDEPEIGRSIERLLDHHDVHLFASLHEAIAALEQLQPDLIICDLMLPGEEVRRLHQHLGEHVPALLPRLIFITGGAFTPTALGFLRDTTPKLLHKPFTQRALLTLVDAALS